MNLKNKDVFDLNFDYLETMIPFLSFSLIFGTTLFTANVFVTSNMFFQEIQQYQESKNLKNSDSSKMEKIEKRKEREEKQDDFFIKTFIPTNSVELNQKVVLSKDLPSVDSRLFTKMEGRIVKILDKSLNCVILQFNPKDFYTGTENSILPFFTQKM